MERHVTPQPAPAGRRGIAVEKTAQAEGDAGQQGRVGGEPDLDLIADQKRGGGHAGHNGLRDIAQALKSQNFARLRLGIGHPGHKDKVLNYVLGQASRSERDKVDAAIARTLSILPKVLSGDWENAVQQLHTKED